VLKGFRDFISRGNVIDLAVAVVIGAAFTTLVQQFTDSFLKPLIRLATGGHPVSGVFYVNGDKKTGVPFDYGSFINVVIGFILTAAVVYFLVVAPMNKLAELRKRGIAPEPEAPSDEVRLLTEIRDALVARGDGGGPQAPVRPDPRTQPPQR
jgi:large conductance mechanosensitive channel